MQRQTVNFSIRLTCDPTRFVELAEEGGVEVFSVQVFLTVALLDLPPYFGHGVALSAIPHQADHLLLHTASKITAQSLRMTCSNTNF